MKLHNITTKERLDEGWGKNLATAGMIGLGALGASGRATAAPPAATQSGALELKPGDPRKPTMTKQGDVVLISFLSSKMPGADEKAFNQYTELAKKKLGAGGYAYKQSRSKEGNRIVYGVKFGGAKQSAAPVSKTISNSSVTADNAGDFLP